MATRKEIEEARRLTAAMKALRERNALSKAKAAATMLRNTRLLRKSKAKRKAK